MLRKTFFFSRSLLIFLGDLVMFSILNYSKNQFSVYIDQFLFIMLFYTIGSLEILSFEQIGRLLISSNNVNVCSLFF